MPSYLIHEFQHCEVTHVKRVVADDRAEAEEIAMEGGGELLGVAIGDTVASANEQIDVLPDKPHNLPCVFYPVEPAPRVSHRGWHEYPEFPVVDWRTEVENDYTRQGYHDWVASKREEASHDQ